MKKKVISLCAAFFALTVFIAPIRAFSQAPEPDPALAAKPMLELFREATAASADKGKKVQLLRALIGKKPQTPADTQALIEAVDSPDLDVQEAAIKKVIEVKETGASSRLRKKVSALPTDRSQVKSEEEYKAVMVYLWSAMALAEMKDKNAMPVMVEKLSGLSSQLGTEQILVLSLAKYGAAVVPVIEKKLNPSFWSAGVGQYGKEELLEVIKNIEDRAAEADLRRLYESEDLQVRSAAARGLRNIGAKVDVTRMIRAITEAEAKLEELDALHTEMIKDKTLKAGSAEEQALFDKREVLFDAAHRMLLELGYTGSPDAIPYLKQRVESKQRKGYSGYAELLAIGQIGGGGVYQYLLEIYRGGGRDTKSSILDIFGNAKMKEAVPFLTEVMNDTNLEKGLRQYAAHSLGNITGELSKYAEIYMEIEEGKR